MSFTVDPTSNKCIEFKVDHTKIDETLTHFPVPVVLDSTHAAVFNELDGQFTGDDFTGTDGDAPDSDLWTITEGSAEIQNNKLFSEITTSAAKTRNYTESTFKITDDFSIQVDFTHNFPAESSSTVLLFLYVDDDNYVYIGINRFTASFYYIGAKNVAGVYTNINTSATTDTSGTFRITQSDGTISLIGGGSTIATVTDFADTTEFTVRLQHNNNTNFPQSEVYWDNFTINSGIVVWPENTNPDRKKIAFTKGDKSTQLYGEIEQWDGDNEKAVIWVSKSDWSISSLTDTVFYMFYDSAQSANDTYIGDTGSRTEVWDSNFKGVWHLSNLTDSTSNNYDLTAYNSPTSGATGQINSAYDFESGSSQYLQKDSAPITDFPFTFQGWINPESLSDTHAIMFIGDKDHDVRYAALCLHASGAAQLAVRKYVTEGTDYFATSTNTTVTGANSFCVATADLSQNLTATLNADFANKGTSVSSITISNHDRIAIGREADLSPRHYADGIIDEVRISNIVRSDAWIKADYHAQSNDLLNSETLDTSEFLDGWSNRIKLTIDHTKIDSDLTHFPVPVVLNSSQAGVFSELNKQITGDDFDGTNGDPPDPDLWQETKYNSGSPEIGNWEIQSNRAQFVISSNQVWSFLPSKFRISGDFDIQVDFNIPSIPIDSYSFGLGLTDASMDSDTISNNFIMLARYNSSNGPYLTNVTDGTSQLGGSEDLSGKLRITRIGSTVTYYRWDNTDAEFKQLNGTQTGTIANVRVDLFARTWTSNHSLTVNFDNFQINSGTVVWPRNYCPNRKKIAFTKGDGITQLYGELEQLNQEDKKTSIWVSKSDWVISSTVDTDFYMYYDSSHADNDTYIGDTGSTPAQNVWESSCKIATHLNGNALDSTSNEHNGTASGISWVSGDLGRQADFSYGDYINFGDHADFKQTTEFTIVITFDPDGIGVGDYWSRIVDFTNTYASPSYGFCLFHDPYSRIGFFTSPGFLLYTLPDAAPRRIGVRFNSAAGIKKLYLDGQVVSSQTNTPAVTYTNCTALNFGNCKNDTIDDRARYDGKLDSFQFYSETKSDAWIKADYYAQLDNLITIDAVAQTEETYLGQKWYGEDLTFTTLSDIMAEALLFKNSINSWKNISDTKWGVHKLPFMVKVFTELYGIKIGTYFEEPYVLPVAMKKLFDELYFMAHYIETSYDCPYNMLGAAIIFVEWYADALKKLQLYDEYYSDTYKVMNVYDLRYSNQSSAYINFLMQYTDGSDASALFSEYYNDTEIINSLFDEYYNNIPSASLFVPEYYNDTIFILSSFNESYNDVLSASLYIEELYPTAFIKTLFSFYYNDLNSSNTIINMPYENNPIHRKYIEEIWNTQYFSEIFMIEGYGISDTTIINSFELDYSLTENNKVQSMFQEPYYLLNEVTKIVTPEVSVIVNGHELDFISCNLNISLTQYCIICGITLSKESDYILCDHLAPVQCIIEGTTYNFFVESKSSSTSNGEVSYSVQALSPTAKLDSPYSRTLIRNYDTDTDAHSVINEMVSLQGISVDIQILNWPLFNYAFSISDETPLEVIKRVVNTVGAVIQTKPNGDLLIISQYDVSPPNWSTATPDEVYTFEDDVISISEQIKINTGYNAFVITDQASSAHNITLAEEDVDAFTKIIKGFRVPFSDGPFDLQTSGGSDISIDKYLYAVEEQVPTAEDDNEWEYVEFIDWTGKTQNPIYEIVDYEWSKDNLGAFQMAEDGTLTIINQESVPSESLLKIKYKTKYWKWTVKSPDARFAQFYVEEL